MPFELYIGPESLRPALLAALLSVLLLVGVFAYLNHFTRRRYFNVWMVAWLFYALWLLLTYNFERHPTPFLLMAKTCAVGVSAVFLAWGSWIFMGQRLSQRLLVLLTLFLGVWSYVGTYHIEQPLQARLPVFISMGVSSLLAARCFFIYRMRHTFAGATLLCAGFALWGLFLAAYPMLELMNEARAVMFVLAALLQLFIAVSMIILVLEEARFGKTSALGRVASERAVRRSLESRVRSTEARCRQLFEQASEAIIIATPGDFIILELNGRARSLLGIHGPGTNISLASFLDRKGLPARAHETQRLDRVPPGAPLNLISRDGKRNAVTVERSSVEIDNQRAFQFVFKEVTERSHLEQQIRQAEKLSALGQMISGVAHELNNPLAIIKGYLDLMLARADVPAAVRADLAKVAHESNRAAKLVRSFLSFAREQPPQRVSVNFNPLVESVVELCRFDSLLAQTRIELDLAPELPDVTADPDQVQQVLVNLISNALHAILNQTEHGHIRVCTRFDGAQVILVVEDNGPGVPLELQPKIFEPFFTTKETGAGTGLGLSIAHSIMTEHGGRIFYSRSALGGAAFTLEFPRGSETLRLPQPVSEQPFVPTRTGRVLVLDDEEALAQLVGEMLRLYGHDVVVTSTPLAALEKIAHEHFDAVVSDYRMPLLDGRDFFHEVMKLDPQLASRIIFLTGDVVSDETRLFFEAIGNPRLTKPFQLDTVARAVDGILLPRAA